MSSEREKRVGSSFSVSDLSAKVAPSAQAEVAPITEAGPSKQASVPKRKHEVDVADREFCKRVGTSFKRH